MPGRLGKNPEVYNIPAHQSFVDVLAKGVVDRFETTALRVALENGEVGDSCWAGQASRWA